MNRHERRRAQAAARAFDRRLELDRAGDDHEWFAQNRSRSHRIRHRFPSEPINGDNEPVPPGHVLLVLVRQIEPGVHDRNGFFLNLEIAPIPDVEEFIHAAFDLTTGREGRVSLRDLITLARVYQCSGVPS
jgi:hypothetical protein